MEKKIEIKQVDQFHYEYKDFMSGKNKYVIVTEWWNGEGFDVDLNGEKQFSLDTNEWNALLAVISFSCL